jgi:hypothetical protein
MIAVLAFVSAGAPPLAQWSIATDRSMTNTTASPVTPATWQVENSFVHVQNLATRTCHWHAFNFIVVHNPLTLTTHTYVAAYAH